MAYIIGPNIDTAPEIGDTVTSGVDESAPFYGYYIDAAGTVALKSPNGNTTSARTVSQGEIVWGLALIGYTGTATLKKLV